LHLFWALQRGFVQVPALARSPSYAPRLIFSGFKCLLLPACPLMAPSKSS